MGPNRWPGPQPHRPNAPLPAPMNFVGPRGSGPGEQLRHPGMGPPMGTNQQNASVHGPMRPGGPPRPLLAMQQGIEPVNLFLNASQLASLLLSSDVRETV